MVSSGNYIEHIAVSGDMWDLIALKYYGDEKKTADIILANPLLSDVIVFSGGEKVKVPTVTKDEVVSSLPPWRR